MKANELQKQIRIGNYLLGKVEDELDERKIYWEIYQIKDSDDFAGIREEWDKPIELTEEILLKIKGVKQGGLTFRIGKYILWFYDGEYYSFMLYDEKDDLPNDKKVYSIELTRVKYLHHLQNVFYSLENKELEINL